MATYKVIKPIVAAGEVLKFLAEQREPISGREVERALCIPYGTVMCYLATLESIRFVRKVGEYYELGHDAAMLWAKKKVQLETKMERNQRELAELEG